MRIGTARIGCSADMKRADVNGSAEALGAHDGAVLMEGPPSEIVAHQDVRRVYLGERFRL